MIKFDLVPDQTEEIDLLIKLVFALRRGIADIAESSKSCCQKNRLRKLKNHRLLLIFPNLWCQTLSQFGTKMSTMSSKVTKPSPNVMNPAGSKSLIVFVVLALCCILGFSSRLFAVIRFESIIHEFDPW